MQKKVSHNKKITVARLCAMVAYQGLCIQLPGAQAPGSGNISAASFPAAGPGIWFTLRPRTLPWPPWWPRHRGPRRAWSRNHGHRVLPLATPLSPRWRGCLRRLALLSCLPRRPNSAHRGERSAVQGGSSSPCLLWLAAPFSARVSALSGESASRRMPPALVGRVLHTVTLIFCRTTDRATAFIIEASVIPLWLGGLLWPPTSRVVASAVAQSDPLCASPLVWVAWEHPMKRVSSSLYRRPHSTCPVAAGRLVSFLDGSSRCRVGSDFCCCFRCCFRFWFCCCFRYCCCCWFGRSCSLFCFCCWCVCCCLSKKRKLFRRFLLLLLLLWRLWFLRSRHRKRPKCRPPTRRVRADVTAGGTLRNRGCRCRHLHRRMLG